MTFPSSQISTCEIVSPARRFGPIVGLAQRPRPVDGREYTIIINYTFNDVLIPSTP